MSSQHANYTTNNWSSDSIKQRLSIIHHSGAHCVRDHCSWRILSTKTDGKYYYNKFCPALRQTRRNTSCRSVTSKSATCVCWLGSDSLVCTYPRLKCTRHNVVYKSNATLNLFQKRGVVLRWSLIRKWINIREALGRMRKGNIKRYGLSTKCRQYELSTDWVPVCIIFNRGLRL